MVAEDAAAAAAAVDVVVVVASRVCLFGWWEDVEMEGPWGRKAARKEERK